MSRKLIISFALLVITLFAMVPTHAQTEPVLQVKAFYTPQALNALGSHEAMVARAVEMVKKANVVYKKSLTQPRVDLTGVSPISDTSYVEPDDHDIMIAQMSNRFDTKLDDATTNRGDADIVLLIVEGKFSAECGASQLLTNSNRPYYSSNSFMTVAVNPDCNTTTFPHELGHIDRYLVN